MVIAARRWTHLIRFLAKEDGQIHLGQIDTNSFPDVGLATFEGKIVDAKVVSGSIYDGLVTDQVLHGQQVNLLSCHGALSFIKVRADHIEQLLPPLTIEQIPIIRCLGLNYRDHAKGSQYGHSQRASALHQTSNMLERTISSKDHHS